MPIRTDAPAVAGCVEWACVFGRRDISSGTGDTAGLPRPIGAYGAGRNAFLAQVKKASGLPERRAWRPHPFGGTIYGNVTGGNQIF